jgi:glutaredoxin 3
MEKRTPDNTKIKIYTTSWCGPCKMAKKLLTEKGFNFEEIDIEEHNISREEMASLAKGPTVPQIIINDLPIGGFEDLIQLFNTEAFKNNYSHRSVILFAKYFFGFSIITTIKSIDSLYISFFCSPL